jgi:hypothetical protein
MIFGTLDSSIVTTMRFTYRDGLGGIIIDNTFQMTVTDASAVAEDSECYLEYVTKEDQISHDLKLVFETDANADMSE